LLNIESVGSGFNGLGKYKWIGLISQFLGVQVRFTVKPDANYFILTFFL